MSQQDIRSAQRPEPDQAMVDIANYVTDYYIGSSEAYTTARYMLLDSLACAMLAMRHPECVKHLGPIVPGAGLPGGARVPGTSFELDPVQAAYNIGVQVRWLDFNDTWHLSGGAQYKWSDTWLLNAGIAYDSGFQSNGSISLALPANAVWRFVIGGQKEESSAFNWGWSLSYTTQGTLRSNASGSDWISSSSLSRA